MRANPDQLGHDLRKHLSTRIRELIADIFDTSARGGLEKNEAVAVVFVGVLHELVLIAQLAGIDQDDVAEHLRRHFEEMAEKKKQAMGGRR